MTTSPCMHSCRTMCNLCPELGFKVGLMNLKIKGMPWRYKRKTKPTYKRQYISRLKSSLKTSRFTASATSARTDTTKVKSTCESRFVYLFFFVVFLSVKRSRLGLGQLRSCSLFRCVSKVRNK